MVARSFFYSGRYETLLSRIVQEGIFWLLIKLFKLLIINLLWILLLPIAFILHLMGFRRLTINTNRIGHLTCEIDCFVKLKKLGLLPKRRYWFVVALPGQIANSHLISYWTKYVNIISHELTGYFMYILSMRGLLIYRVDDYILSFNDSANYYEVNNKWHPRPPLLSIDKEDGIELKRLLTEMGVPDNGWYVCFHCREGGFSKVDEVIHSHRNANIENFVEAMKYVVDLGGWCIRMGDSSMKPLKPLVGVIDYAHHPLRSERADVILCAGCKFFVGSSSGLWNLASIFGVPSALTNMIPLSTFGYSPKDLSIPKLLKKTTNGQVLKFADAFSDGLSNLRTASAYIRNEIETVENNSEEILSLVMDMYESITIKDFNINESLQLQFRKHMKSYEYGFKSRANIGPRFLEKYKNLM